jgi:hypothetical protein
MLELSSVCLGGGLLYDWLIPSGRVDFISAGGSLLLILTDLNFLVSGIGLLVLGSLMGLAVTLGFVALAKGVGEA